MPYHEPTLTRVLAMPSLLLDLLRQGPDRIPGTQTVRL